MFQVCRANIDHFANPMIFFSG